MGPDSDKQAVGFTTTIPVEIVLAAGMRPLDLNNRFITHPDPAGLLRRAEEEGLPRTLCAWIKGIYLWCLEHPQVQTIVGVTQGDCSNTHALMELLRHAGRRVIPFEFPQDRDPRRLKRQLQRLAAELGTSLAAAQELARKLAPLRHDLKRLDRLTWQRHKVSGLENHLWLLGSSDFEGDWQDYHRRLLEFLASACRRPPRRQGVRLGILGVPPIMSDLHQRLEELGARVVFNEVPRQFAMPPAGDQASPDLVEQYLRYTYPYDVFHRLEDLRREIQRRRLQGLVHYTQSFCYRQTQDIILRRELKLPMLTLEGDRPGPVDARSRMRLEAFVDLMR